MRKITASTDVLLREQRYERGTEFEVREDAADGMTPVAVEPGIAAHWLRIGWATEVPADVPAKVKAK